MHNLILQPGEEIILRFRRSSAVLVPAALLTLALFAVPVWYGLRYSVMDTIIRLYPVWGFVVGVWFLHRYFLWFREVYTVSTHRFVKVSHESIFQRVITETALDRILNVSLRTTGPWSMFAGFGDIELQVVGRVDPLVIRSVARPAEVKEFLWRLHEQSLAQSRGHGMQEYATPHQKMVS
ncbi:MAG: PH domain-containing protein [Candidatus Doudnabacteria bacterium]|nr:PH domain-containing protein [Candidatus Doudnabacteria bacterium]